jgi:acyl-ACP thioesterase
MKNKYLQHDRDVIVAVSDTDFNARIKPSAIMGYFQDIATEHADMLGIGYSDLRSQDLGWVMIRMSFKIMQSPKVGETITIKTFPEKPKAADVNRGYCIENKAGETIVTASSKWCVVDVNTHKIRRCAPLFTEFNDSDYIPTSPLDDANPKIEKLSDYGEVIGEPLKYTVQVTDLDYNVHMNNARYGDVILNICTVNMLRENTISRVDINFMSQLFIGDCFDVYKVQKDNITFIEAKKCDSEAVVFRGRIEWNES